MNRCKSWLESLDTPVLEIRPYVDNTNAEPKDAPMIEVLKAESEKLELRYAAERSLLDRLIYRFSSIPTAEPPDQAAGGEPETQPAAKSIPASAEVKRRRKPKAAAPTGTGDTDTAASRIRAYIAHHPEFRVKDMVAEIGLTKSGASCAVAKLAAAKQITRIGYGRYSRTPAFRPGDDTPAVEARYAEFRKSVPVTTPSEP